jgi:hypothetical protein
VQETRIMPYWQGMQLDAATQRMGR